MFERYNINPPPPAPASVPKVNAPPAVPEESAKRRRLEPAPPTGSTDLSAAEQRYEDSRRRTKLQSGWLCRAVALCAAWRHKDFDRLEHLAKTFRTADPTFRSRLDDHMGYMARHGQDPQYNY